MAEAQREALVSEGMSPTLLEDQGRIAAEFEAVSELAHSARSARSARLDHIGARADLEEVTSELVEQWNAAKHVPGVSPSRVSPPPAGAGAVSPNAGGVTSVA